MNACVAECSGQARHSEGYCPGERMRFSSPDGASGGGGGGNATAAAASKNATAAAPAGGGKLQRAATVAHETMAKFAAQGFSFLGHAPLSRSPMRRKPAPVKEAAFVAEPGSSDGGDAGGGGGGPVRVEILRGDRAGNIFYKRCARQIEERQGPRAAHADARSHLTPLVPAPPLPPCQPPPCDSSIKNLSPPLLLLIVAPPK